MIDWRSKLNPKKKPKSRDATEVNFRCHFRNPGLKATYLKKKNLKREAFLRKWRQKRQTDIFLYKDIDIVERILLIGIYVRYKKWSNFLWRLSGGALGCKMSKYDRKFHGATCPCPSRSRCNLPLALYINTGLVAGGTCSGKGMDRWARGIFDHISTSYIPKHLQKDAIRNWLLT